MNKAAYLLLVVPISAAGAGSAHAEDSSPQLAQVSTPQASPAQSTQTSSAQTTLPRIVVTGTAAAENNYRVDTLDSIGPLGTTDIQNTPYTI